MFTEAGTDITSGHAIDSLVRQELVDPWAPDCLQRFVDTLVNHQRTYFGLPTTVASTLPLEFFLPALFRDAQQRSLLSPVLGPSADQIEIRPDDRVVYLCVFHTWLEHPTNAARLEAWLRLHFENIDVARGHQLSVPDRYLATSYQLANLPSLAARLGIGVAQLDYAFDVFVRTVQYHIALGESRPYFPHPLRDTLILDCDTAPVPKRVVFSWGAYVAHVVEINPSYRSAAFILDTIEALREEVHAAHRGVAPTYYALSGLPSKQQIALIEATAADAKLPGKLKDDVQKTLKKNIDAVQWVLSGVAGVTIPEAIDKMFAVLLINSGVYKIKELVGSILPGAMSGMRLLKGRMEWPRLFTRM